MPASSETAALAARLSGHLLIDGKLVPAISGRVFPVLNPALGESCGSGAFGDRDDVERAVQSALKAQTEWAKIAARERGRLVTEVGRLIRDHAEELAQLMALETGKAIRTECRVETSAAADLWTFYGGLGSELKGEVFPFRQGVLAYTQREPIGVVAGIIPWNVPLLMLGLKACPALVAGNSIIIKSAEEAPLAVLRIAELAQAVLPPGVFNMLSGMGPECGAPLAQHPKVKKISFTGSVETGKIVASIAAEKLISVTLELGGKSPMIVMPDADLEKAAEGAVIGVRFSRQGQSCTCASRIFVHRSLVDPFVASLKKRVDAMVIGDPFDEKTDIGCIISPAQFERVTQYVELGEKAPGATAHRVGQMSRDPALSKGLFVQPIIFTGLTNDHKTVRDEIFGPVTAVMPFDDFDEVLDAANDTEYGLAATIWTQNLKWALEGVNRLEAGIVQVNQNLVVQANLSYGGIKSSGLGKEASLEAMAEHFTYKKTILINMT